MTQEKRYKLAKTGNLALDSLVNDKYESASANGIQMSCRLDVPAELFVENEDLCVILENLLDNALDAVRELQEEKRRVSLIVRLTKGAIFISVKNPCIGGSLEDSWEKLQKSKIEDHGIRLSSVERMTEKYYGDVSLNQEEGLFSVSVLLLQEEIIH